MEKAVECSNFCGYIEGKDVVKMKFVGVREFKQGVVKYLHGKSEVVVTKRKGSGLSI